MPFLAFLVSQINSLDFFREIDIEITTSIFFSYIASLLFAFSAISANILCPNDVKKHISYKNYLDFLIRTGLNLYEMREHVARSTENNAHTHTPAPADQYNINEKNKESMIRFYRELVKEEASRDMAEIFVKIIRESPQKWGETIESQEWKRILIGYCYIISLTISFILFFIYMPYRIYSLTSLSNL
tara:strand:- start:711 stop:1271 length:561 start_codon:yes stop_codon:yes gene_type:complete